jgi:hypothetical protein
MVNAPLIVACAVGVNITAILRIEFAASAAQQVLSVRY